jgi:hypothetical protein
MPCHARRLLAQEGDGEGRGKPSRLHHSAVLGWQPQRERRDHLRAVRDVLELDRGVHVTLRHMHTDLIDMTDNRSSGSSPVPLTRATDEPSTSELTTANPAAAASSGTVPGSGVHGAVRTAVVRSAFSQTGRTVPPRPRYRRCLLAMQPRMLQPRMARERVTVLATHLNERTGSTLRTGRSVLVGQ